MSNFLQTIQSPFSGRPSVGQPTIPSAPSSTPDLSNQLQGIQTTLGKMSEALDILAQRLRRVEDRQDELDERQDEGGANATMKPMTIKEDKIQDPRSWDADVLLSDIHREHIIGKLMDPVYDALRVSKEPSKAAEDRRELVRVKKSLGKNMAFYGELKQTNEDCSIPPAIQLDLQQLQIIILRHLHSDATAQVLVRHLDSRTVNPELREGVSLALAFAREEKLLRGPALGNGGGRGYGRGGRGRGRGSGNADSTA